MSISKEVKDLQLKYEKAANKGATPNQLKKLKGKILEQMKLDGV